MFGKFSTDEAFEAGKTLTQKAANQVTKQVSATASSAVQQFNIPVPTDQGTSEGLGGGQVPSLGNGQDKLTQDFVQDLYGTSNTGQQTPQGSQPAVAPGFDEQQQLAAARKKLKEFHMQNYYVPTFERPKQKEQSVSERLEEEKQVEEAEKMEELQVQKKKDEVPMAIRMANQKAEKFRGAAG